jgi:hypothetical protein
LQGGTAGLVAIIFGDDMSTTDAIYEAIGKPGSMILLLV